MAQSLDLGSLLRLLSQYQRVLGGQSWSGPVSNAGLAYAPNERYAWQPATQGPYTSPVQWTMFDPSVWTGGGGKPGWSWQDWQNWTPDQVQRASLYNENLIPYLNLASQIAQAQSEQGENTRRWEIDTANARADEAWAQDYKTRQQDWTETYGDRELDLKDWYQTDQSQKWRDELGLSQRAQDELTAWRNAELDWRDRNTKAETEQAAISAWGRRNYGNVRYAS
jgi:hypothetical protein